MSMVRISLILTGFPAVREVSKMTYYELQELGKRAARQLASEWPTLFAFDRDEPRLEAFRPAKDADPLQVVYFLLARCKVPS